MASAKKKPTIPDIIQLAGGAPQIARASKGKLTVDAVYKWPKIGIPDRHWPLIKKLSATTTSDQLLEANQMARRVAL